MSRFVTALALALLLASCGRSGGGGQHAGSGAACALIAQPESLFGAGVQSIAAGDVGAGSCRWESTDGRRGGDVILYDAASLGNVAPHDFVAQTAQRWGAAQPDYPIEAVNGLGDEAQMANHLPGYQTQIVFRKGERVVTLLAWSGDPAMSGEQLARRMAQAAASAP